jgi:hypothetical protein
MRFVSLLAAIFCSIAAALAGGIREFNVPTLERLGNEISQVSRRRPEGIPIKDEIPNARFFQRS